MRAIQREVVEELGYDIEKGILQDEVLSISELAEAVAPVFAPFRFRTWFYRIKLKKIVPLKLILEKLPAVSGALLKICLMNSEKAKA
ncbi:MAG: hypothetical protein CM1200mP28_06300 [Deltaproteobacteria bacterium]|nr:MAG: hypothetical protein CM1200mP28_06300 [Deltaproteobacteria bacterium]